MIYKLLSETFLHQLRLDSGYENQIDAISIFLHVHNENGKGNFNINYMVHYSALCICNFYVVFRKNVKRHLKLVYTLYFVVISGLLNENSPTNSQNKHIWKGRCRVKKYKAICFRKRHTYKNRTTISFYYKFLLLSVFIALCRWKSSLVNFLHSLEV